MGRVKGLLQYAGAGLLGAYVGFGIMEHLLYKNEKAMYGIDPRTEFASMISIHAIGAAIARYGSDEQLEDWYDLRHGHMNPDGSWTRLSEAIGE